MAFGRIKAASEFLFDMISGALLVTSAGIPGNPVSSDGTGAFVTATDAAGTLVAAPVAGRVYRKLVINSALCANAVLFSLDGGVTWVRHPAYLVWTYDCACSVAIQAKNAVAGANVSIFASAY